LHGVPGAPVDAAAEPLLVERAERDADQRDHARRPAERRAGGHDRTVVQNQQDAEKTQRQTHPLPAGHRLAHEAVGDGRGQDRLQSGQQRRYAGRHALADRDEDAAQIEEVHHCADRKAVSRLVQIRPACAARGRDDKHDRHDARHSDAEKGHRLDVRQAITRTNKARAPQHHEDDWCGSDSESAHCKKVPAAGTRP